MNVFDIHAIITIKLYCNQLVIDNILVLYSIYKISV